MAFHRNSPSSLDVGARQLVSSSTGNENVSNARSNSDSKRCWTKALGVDAIALWPFISEMAQTSTEDVLRLCLVAMIDSCRPLPHSGNGRNFESDGAQKNSAQLQFWAHLSQSSNIIFEGFYHL